MKEKYLEMTDDELIHALKTYAMAYDGTTGAAIAYAASIRIAVLVAKMGAEKEGGEDD